MEINLSQEKLEQIVTEQIAKQTRELVGKRVAAFFDSNTREIRDRVFNQVDETVKRLVTEDTVKHNLHMLDKDRVRRDIACTVADKFIEILTEYRD